MGITTCKICGGSMSLFDNATIMNKYDIKYYRCQQCGLITTEEPFWSEESYSSAITDSDIGMIGRNIMLSTQISAIIKAFYNQKSLFLDYGGGYGIFTRMMRDKGFDFEWYDAYCDNIFARGHEKKHDKYDIITCFEMFEHVYEPGKLIEELSDLADTILFSTELNDYANPHALGDWWYYGLDHGQHVSIYTAKALEALARRVNKNYYTCGNIHIFTGNELNKVALKLCNKYTKLVDRFVKRESLLEREYEDITGQKLNE